ncbi:hypothetical protein HK099_007990 [Clydaea vesicula]|uniref:Deacetylase sirtuin-type domain-containing protein n=1 Tax=Clydaea vesicula TaxID=447962 RepID=A0AAD5TZA6_9FUNG|nr:hypothetical protein HK099_007990 [Clydaea vesicula]
METTIINKTSFNEERGNCLEKQNAAIFISLGKKETEVDRTFLNEVIKALWRSKKTLVATGAGISVSAGIPDFRSENGLYNLVKERYPKVIMKGKDLFDANVFRDINSSQVFFSFMAELKLLIDKATITPTHTFIKWLEEEKKLLRCYTQNIDCLEKKLNMNSQLDKKSKNVNKIVQVHGDMDYVFCVICRANFDFNQEVIDIFKGGKAPSCSSCELKSEERERSGRRGLKEGFLRPNIVLYNEHHTNGELISEFISHDMRRKPDLMIVIGTSLKIVGMKNLVKEMAKKVHEFKNGKVILINKIELGKEWEEVFDYIILADCDQACTKLKNGYKIYNEQVIKELQAKENKKPSKTKNKNSNANLKFKMVKSTITVQKTKLFQTPLGGNIKESPAALLNNGI